MSGVAADEAAGAGPASEPAAAAAAAEEEQRSSRGGEPCCKGEPAGAQTLSDNGGSRIMSDLGICRTWIMSDLGYCQNLDNVGSWIMSKLG